MNPVVLDCLDIGGLGPSADADPEEVLGDGVGVADREVAGAKERLAADDVERNLAADGRLAGFLDVLAIVARFVGHQHDQELALVGDQRRCSG